MKTVKKTTASMSKKPTTKKATSPKPKAKMTKKFAKGGVKKYQTAGTSKAGKTVNQMSDAEKKAYGEAFLKSQNKDVIIAGEKAYLANKDGRVSIVDYAGKGRPYYTKTIDTTGLAKGAKNFEVEKDLDRGKGYNPRYTPITKTAALKAINNWKNQTNKEKVAANKEKVRLNANKVAVNALKYEKRGGKFKSKPVTKKSAMVVKKPKTVSRKKK